MKHANSILGQISAFDAARKAAFAAADAADTDRSLGVFIPALNAGYNKAWDIMGEQILVALAAAEISLPADPDQALWNAQECGDEDEIAIAWFAQVSNARRGGHN